jgi:hypothetical protein
MPFRHLTQWPELRSSTRVIILGMADRLSTLERERVKERERGGGRKWLCPRSSLRAPRNTQVTHVEAGAYLDQILLQTAKNGRIRQPQPRSSSTSRAPVLCPALTSGATRTLWTCAGQAAVF